MKAQKFKIQMAKVGHNQRTLAAAVPINEQYLSLILNGRKSTTLVMAQRICNQLGCEVGDVFDLKDGKCWVGC